MSEEFETDQEEVYEEIEEAVAPSIEEVVVTPKKVVAETISTATDNNKGSCSHSVGTGLMAFTGNCSNCGSYNCLSVVVDGMFRCSTCKVQVSAQIIVMVFQNLFGHNDNKEKKFIYVDDALNSVAVVVDDVAYDTGSFLDRVYDVRGMAGASIHLRLLS